MRPVTGLKRPNPVALSVLAALLLMSVCSRPLSAQILTPQSRGIAGTVKLKGKATTDHRIEVTLLTGDGRPVERVFADALGSFQFLGVGPGGYIIVIDEPGYQRVEDTIEIPARSLTLQRRYYVLEPRRVSSAPPDASVLSAQKFLVPKEARESFEKGEQELSKRHYQAAAEHLDHALAVAPNFADALHARALIHLQQNNLPQARELFEKAIASNPQLGDAQIGLGSTYVRQGDPEAGIEPLTKGLALSPNSYLGHFERCRANFNLGRLELAEADCARARELAASARPELNVLLGNLYLRQGRRPEALREFEEYLRLDSSSATSAQVRSVVRSLIEAGVKAPK